MAELIHSYSETEQNFTPVQSVDMTIDSASFGRLIKQSIEMYQNAPEAVFREYATNARDAHIAAGKADVPIEITVPEGFGKGELVVRDHGVGLDDKGLEIYVSVGTSTKDIKGNKETGSFGQGSKSALSLTPQFSVIAIKDGIKRFAMVGENDRGGYSRDIFREAATVEPNGVTVKIPLDRDQASNMRRIAHDFLKYWDKGTVLLNGEEPTHYLDEVDDANKLVLDSGSLIFNPEARGSASKIKVKMGAVVYPVDVSSLLSNMTAEQLALFAGEGKPYYSREDSFLDNVGISNSGTELLVEVPLSSMKLVPSRDGLVYTRRDEDTVGTLVSAMLTVRNELRAEAQRKIDTSTSFAEAEDNLQALSGMLSSQGGLNKVKWGGAEYSMNIAKEDTEGSDFYAESYSWNLNFRDTSLRRNGEIDSVVRKPSTAWRRWVRMVIDASASDSKLTSHRNGIRDYARAISDGEYTDKPLKDSLDIMVFTGESNYNPWVFDNDNIISLPVAEVHEKAKAYRKWKRAQVERGQAPRPRPKETSYLTAFSFDGDHHTENRTVSSLPEGTKTAVLVKKNLPFSLRAAQYFLEEEHTVFMSLKGGRSADKLKANLQSAGIAAYDYSDWIDELTQEIASSERNARIGVISHLGYNHYFANLVASHEWLNTAQDIELCGVKLSDWSKNAGDSPAGKRESAIRKIVPASRLVSDEDSEELYEKLESSVPSNAEIAEKYPMIKVLGDEGFSRITINKEENFRLIADYVASINSAESGDDD